MIGTLLFVAVAFGLAGCGDDPVEPPFDIEEVEFAPELGIDLDAMEERPSGLFLETLVEPIDPEGEQAAEGERVWVDYTLWLPDGTIVDSSPEGEPFDFVIGATGTDQVIPGFEEGVEGMVVGEVRRLVIPPDLGYADTTVVFEVEFLGVGEEPPEEPQPE